MSFRLLNWIQSKVPDIPISNFTTDWNDGKAVGALVDAVAPGNYKTCNVVVSLTKYPTALLNSNYNLYL